MANFIQLCYAIHLNPSQKYNFQAHEQDIPMVVSSAPSSAYYSDLSVTAMPGGASGSNQGAYEIVGLNVMSQPLPNWEHHGGGGGNGVGGVATTGLATGDAAAAAMTQRRMPRLAAINETSTSTVPSDYV